MLVNYSDQVSLMLNEQQMGKGEKELKDGDIFEIFDLRWKWRVHSQIYLLSEQIESLQSKLSTSQQQLLQKEDQLRSLQLNFHQNQQISSNNTGFLFSKTNYKKKKKS
jgi:hypothetical protein